MIFLVTGTPDARYIGELQGAAGSSHEHGYCNLVTVVTEV